MTIMFYKGELTEEQATLYNAIVRTCFDCNSDELVWQNTIGDAVCEDCGKWQNEEEEAY